MQLSLGKGFLRVAVLLGFMGCLIAQGNLFGAAASSEPLTATAETLANASARTAGFWDGRFSNPSRGESDALGFKSCDSRLANPVEIGLPDEFGVSLEDEDSIEMFRFDVQQRTFAVDRTMIAAKAAPKIERNARPSISSPLLV